MSKIDDEEREYYLEKEVHKARVAIEGLRKELAFLKAENEALKKQVRELQEWHDSHL